jgi:PAS domain S-box-containing protein
LARPREELIGQSTEILGEDASQGATQRQILQRTLREGAWRGEVVNVTGDGRRRVLDCRTQMINDADGAPLALGGIATDITERKQAETTLRELKELHESIVQTMNEGVVLTDIDGKVTFINPELAALLGWTPEELVGRSWLEFVPPEHQAAAREADARRAAGQADRYEIELQRRDGTRIPVLVGGTPRLDPLTGWFAGCLGVFTDLSEQKHAERERQRLQAQLYQAQKMESVGRLAGGVAHDYNNMLSVIIGYAEMALDRLAAGDPLRADLLEILQAARHSADITRQLLGFARKQPINPRIMDLNDTVEGMLKMLRRLIGEDIDLSWQPATGLWPVKMDPIQLDQVLANLCVNARDAIEGVGKISIGTRNTHLDAIKGPDAAGFEAGDFVLLSVSDDGSGMDEETLDRLFEPFFTTKPFGQGTGLGLATVYGIERQNNGYIQVSSRPGHGAVFHIYLPRQRREAEVSQASVVDSDDLPRGRGETILIVEDEAPILAVARQMLERLGYAMLTASSPGQAVELARAHSGHIALVIADVVMPGMNGRELVARLKKGSPDLKVLFMSGYTADVVAQRGVLENDTPFIQKPFTLHELAVRVRQALESP